MKPSPEKRWFYTAWIAACISVAAATMLRGQFGEGILLLPIIVGILLGVTAAISLQINKKAFTARRTAAGLEVTIQLQARKAGLQSYPATPLVFPPAWSTSNFANAEAAKSVGIENQPRVVSLLAFA